MIYASAFFPPGLHPILNGGKWNKDPMIAPQMPGGRPIRQSVLHDKPHRQSHNRVGVVAFRQSEIGHVGVEVNIALDATMLRICDAKIARPPGERISKIVQRSLDAPKPIGAAATLRTATPLVITAPPDNLWFRKVFNTSDPFARIGDVFTGLWHDDDLQKQDCF